MTSWSPPSLAAQIAMGVAFSALIAIGFTGNVLVCIAIYTNKRLRKKENLYFVSLAGADLLLTVLVMPFAAVNDVAGHWLFGEYCKIWMSFDIMCCTCSILHLCAISFDRYYHIHDPLLYSERMSGRKIFTAILSVWTLSSAIAFVPLSFETHFDQALSIIWLNTSRSPDDCYDQDHHHAATYSESTTSSRRIYGCSFNLQPTYAIISSLVSFYVPSAIMIGAYAKLYSHAQRHAQIIKRQMKAATSSLINASSTDLHRPNTDTHLQPPQSSNYDKRRFRLSPSRCQHGSSVSLPSSTKRRDLISSDSKARVTLGAILGTFLLSWLPFFVCNVVRAFCPSCIPEWMFLTLTWMGYANSAQNPIIYSIFNRDFRYAFRKILLCRKRAKGSGLGGGSAAGQSCTGPEDLVIVNGSTAAMTIRSANTFLSGSTAV